MNGPLARCLSSLILAAACCLGLWPSGQEPQDPQRPPPPPQGAPPLPTVEEPFVSPVPRTDLQQRFDRPDPIEGFYQLQARVVAGATVPQGSRGWLAVGRRHLLIQLEAHGVDARIPLLRSGARAFRREGDALVLTALGGHHTTPDGEVVVERERFTETRRVEIVGNVLRVHQDAQSWLDFVRIE